MQRKEIIIEVISYVFILLFLYTGIMKLIDYKTFNFDLLNAPIIKKLNPILAFTIPISELVIAALLFMPKTRKVGLYSSFWAMVLFTIYVGGILSFVKKKPCTCGGVLRSLSWDQHLVLNITLTALAMIAILLSKRSKELSQDVTRYKVSI